MPTLILIRGIPGSGKSTLAERLMGENDVHLEADMFWGKDYKFDVTKLREAHEWCLNSAKAAMAVGKGDVIVANTFTQGREAAKYVESAKCYGYDVQVLSLSGPWDNIHNVPEEVMEKMRERFQSNRDFCNELYI